jgi:hypothetical protein
LMMIGGSFLRVAAMMGPDTFNRSARQGAIE